MVKKKTETESSNKPSKKTMSKEEYADFIELCEYVRYQILEYTTDIKFPTSLALRIKGLHEGKFMANNKVKPMANYDYKTILLAFKLHKFDIAPSIRNTGNFKDESHRINYMMAIIESKINNVVLMQKKKQKAEKHSEELELHIETGAEYTKKTKEVHSSKMDNLW